MRYFPAQKHEVSLIDDDLLESWFDLPLFNQEQRFGMKTDIKEVKGQYVLDIDLPGFNKEDINISMEHGYLTVTAKQEESKEEKDKEHHFIRRERYTGSCSRSYYVGDVKEESIKAAYEKGILSIEFPKEPPVVEKKKFISIK